ncbi:hypothetical protein [Spirochaeta dissipatitropha]
MKVSVSKTLVLAFLVLCVSVLPVYSRSINFGIENRYTPAPEGFYNDVRGFVYAPAGPLTAGLALTRSDRGDWSRWMAEGGAVWVWGGPFYSEARYGLSLDSADILSHHAYMDLFFEQASYYLTGSVRGRAASDAWSVTLSFGGAYFGFARNLLNSRVYYAQDPDNTTVSLAFWNRYRLLPRLDLHNGASVGTNLSDFLDYDASMSAGLSWLFTPNWRAGYQFKQDFPYVAGGRTSHHELFITASVALGSGE